jgi:hypothetical protein
MTATAFHGEKTNDTTAFTYMYSYSQAGRVTTQRMRATFGALPPVDFDAAYTWDNEGRMTGVTYPDNQLPGPNGGVYGPKYAYQYDDSALGRLTGMTEWLSIWNWEDACVYRTPTQTALQQIQTPGQYVGHSSKNSHFLFAMRSNYDNSLCRHLKDMVSTIIQFSAAGINDDTSLGWRAVLQNGSSSQPVVRQLGSNDVRVGGTDFLLYP